MKKFYFLLIGICFFTTVNAQIVNIPDANFKAKLLQASSSNKIAKNLSDSYFKIDTNNNGQIEQNEALNIKELDVSLSKITNLIGIEFFINLTYLDCYYNEITNLNITNNSALTYLSCTQNLLSSLDVTNNTALVSLHCGANLLTSLNVNNNTALTSLTCGSNRLTNLDVSKNTKLTYLSCYSNQLTNLDMSNCIALGILGCESNQLTNINVNYNTLLKELTIGNNQLTNIDVSNNTKLTKFLCQNNRLKSLDLSNNGLLTGSIWVYDNQLESLFLKNGNNEICLFYNNPNLKFICVDESQLSSIQSSVNSLGYTNCQVNSYCSFTPGGAFYTIQGNQKYDLNQNGCDSSDEKILNLNLRITDGMNVGNIISNATGNYSIPVGEGTQKITPVLENPNYFNVSPASISVTFPTQTSPFIQNFCITPNGVHHDLEVTILPTIPARPGFNATYKIIYKNKGNQTQSGSVNLSFNDAVLDYVSAVPTINNQVTDKLTWDYTDLQPQESREITVTLNLNSPMKIPAVNIGDRLSFNALINPVSGDEKPVDNSSALRQSVVGSFDPNDKTCLEGDIITPSLIGEYVHYLIRFENTGTYPAQNVVIKDLIDLTKFDISTLVLTKASHDFITKISDGNKVEFIFENINLPFDDATNDGYIAFKIKTLPTLVVGDSFENEANIFFDYNFPVLTNKAKSTFKTLGTQDFEFSYYFSVYPNPVNDVLNIGTKDSIEVKSIAVYDILGQLIIAVPDAKNVTNIDVSKLSTGNYFLKMNTNKGTSNVKFIKK